MRKKIPQSTCSLSRESIGRKSRFIWMMTLTMDVRNNLSSNYFLVSFSVHQIKPFINIVYKNSMEWIVLPSFYRLASKGPEVLKSSHTASQQVKRDWFYLILNTARALNEFISITSR